MSGAIGVPVAVYPGLDSIRAFAALAVLATHTSFWAGTYGAGLLGAMTARLDVGVAIFFVLSGFLLGKPFLAAQARRSGSPEVGVYLWRRALRILPLYLITVVIAMLTLSDNRGAGAGQWARQLTLTQNYPTPELVAGLTHMWSLSVEVTFYLVLPFAMIALARLVNRRRWRPGATLVVTAACAVISWLWLGLVTPHLAGANLWLPAYLAWFGGGVALAVAVVQRESGEPPAGVVQLASQPGVCLSMAAAAFCVAATPLAGPVLLIQPTASEAVVKSILYTIVATLVVLPAVLGDDDGRYARVLAWRPLRHLGHISYGIFCLHLLVLHAAAAALDLPLYQGNGWLLLGITTVGSIAAAEVAYRVVERPSMRWRRPPRFGRRSPATTATATTTAS